MWNTVRIWLYRCQYGLHRVTIQCVWVAGQVEVVRATSSRTKHTSCSIWSSFLFSQSWAKRCITRSKSVRHDIQIQRLLQNDLSSKTKSRDQYECMLLAVRFRVIPVRRNLLPYSDRFDVYIVDPNNALVWRWLYQQPNAGGIMELEFPLADQVTYGNWSVRVDYKGFSYYKKFIVREYCTSLSLSLIDSAFPYFDCYCCIVFFFDSIWQQSSRASMWTLPLHIWSAIRRSVSAALFLQSTTTACRLIF